MDTWTCPHCGFTPDTQDQTPSGACPKCGAPIATESPAEKATPPADATPGQSTEGTPETQAEPSPDAEATPEAEAPSEAGRGGAWRERLAALRARLAETARDGWEKAKPWVDAAGPRLRAAYETAKAKTPDGLKKVGGFLDRIRPYCRRFFLWSRSSLPPIFLDRALLCGGCFTLARGISRFFHFENSKRPKHDFWVTVILLRVALFCTPLLVLEAVATFDFRALLQIQIALGLYGLICIILPTACLERIPPHIRAVRLVAKRKGLVRLPGEGWVSGICAGLAAKYDVSVTLIRVIAIVGLCLIPGFVYFAYALLQTFLPEDGEDPGLVELVERELDSAD